MSGTANHGAWMCWLAAEPATPGNLHPRTAARQVPLCVAGYAFLLSPNQTPFRDQFFLEKLTGINPSSTVDVGRIFFNLFNIMGECGKHRQ